MPNNNIAGLIVAAGLSSRMNAFKPLLPLKGKPLIERTVDTLRPWVGEIYVVTGCRQEEVRRALQPSPAPVPPPASVSASAPASSPASVPPPASASPSASARASSPASPSPPPPRNIHFIYNERFADTGMFESVRLGVQALAAGSGGFFLLPGDMPLVTGHTLRSILEAHRSPEIAVVQPFYRGKPGHPPLILASCYEYICAYGGEGGLRGALTFFKDRTLRLDVPDPAIRMDADLPEDYDRLLRCAEESTVPSPEVCEEIWKWFQTPELVTTHCRLVAETAREWALKLIQAGHSLNLDLVTAGALLHDVAKGVSHRDHDTVGADWLEDMGYPTVAEVVRAHTNLPEDALNPLDERAVVHLADKQVQKTTKVTVNQRFQTVLDRFADDPEALTAINRRKRNVLEILEKIHAILGESPQEKNIDKTDSILI